ncbi:metal ABC transporter ATP-binding protein [Anaeromassilibacillus senegalensis]|uniref:metal ABC transporter ATP-binding protein n=1 Tax=Anaeromassilibacillus senegalensis TaxID=1673717 RepID=UPI0006813762|nr:metal ABC transporter ATP-binding protein [Anaeromassilibacillus senegalensis]
MEQCKCSTQIRNLTVHKRDGVIIHDVSLDVHHGEIMALIGRNGAGKTTLLKALLGRIPYSGSIVFTNPKGERVQKPRIGYVPQNMVFDRSTPMTVADMLCANLSEFPVWLGHQKEKRERANAMLEKVGGYHLLNKRLGSLSGGEMQRVLLAFALEPLPDLLLLDEPVSAVDRKGIEVFYDLVTSLRSEFHMPVILVSHDLSHVQRYATRAALLDRTIVVSGPVDKVMRSPEVQEAFGLKLAREVR